MIGIIGSLLCAAVTPAVLVAGRLIAVALAPLAMSTFGLNVPGVGALHAAGGVAATLQSFSAAALCPQLAAFFFGSAGLGMLTSFFTGWF